MLWGRVKEQIEDYGGSVQMNSQVVGINRVGHRITSVDICRDGVKETVGGTDFISSMPVTVLLRSLNPPPPAAVLEAAAALKYRDFMTVCLIVDQAELFPDNWIYIHDPAVKVGRIQNYKNWSPEMVPDPLKSSLGLEYFCNEGDDLWMMADADLIELAKQELAAIGLASAGDIQDGVVYRLEKTYPVYDTDYAHNLKLISDYLGQFDNFQTVGRNGLHRYNNQDHAMLTGMLAVRNMLKGENYNLWIVNAEEKYHEEIQIGDELVEMAGKTRPQDFPRFNPISLGLSVGAVAGLTLFTITLILWILKFRMG
jgi:protoporphyrinogen oxidase